MHIENLKELLLRYGCGPVRFTGTDDALFERRLVLDHIVPPQAGGPHQLDAAAAAARGVLAARRRTNANGCQQATTTQVE